jgi:hypothetical protein
MVKFKCENVQSGQIDEKTNISTLHLYGGLALSNEPSIQIIII